MCLLPGNKAAKKRETGYELPVIERFELFEGPIVFLLVSTCLGNGTFYERVEVPLISVPADFIRKI